MYDRSEPTDFFNKSDPTKQGYIDTTLIIDFPPTLEVSLIILQLQSVKVGYFPWIVAVWEENDFHCHVSMSSL